MQLRSLPSGSGQKTLYENKTFPLGPKEALYNRYLIHSVPLCSKFATIAIGRLGPSLQLLLLDDLMFL